MLCTSYLWHCGLFSFQHKLIGQFLEGQFEEYGKSDGQDIADCRGGDYVYGLFQLHKMGILNTLYGIYGSTMTYCRCLIEMRAHFLDAIGQGDHHRTDHVHAERKFAQVPKKTVVEDL